MSDTTTNWSLTTPDAGEVDTAQVQQDNLEIIDNALLSPAERAQLTGLAGEPGDSYDIPHTTPSAEPPAVVTTSHYHHAPLRVPNADNATNAAEATHATRADVAEALDPPITVNGSAISAGDDISVPRVAFGVQDPSIGWPSSTLGNPRRCDIYIKTVS